jgi:hypothetical protein
VNLGFVVDALDEGICGSITADCSPQRVEDAYRTAKRYHDVLQRVTAAYAAIPAGAASPVADRGGETVGGAVKAEGVVLRFSDVPWILKFEPSHISCCDCFHPSTAGQDLLARGLFDGIACSALDVCCKEEGSTYERGLCAEEETGGRYYPGFF